MSIIIFPSGNAVLLKPSDLAINISNLLMEIIPQYLDQVRHLNQKMAECFGDCLAI